MFYIGMLAGAAILALVLWVRSKGWTITWYQWLIGIVGTAFLFLTVQHYFGSMREYVNLSANLGLLYFGIPAIVLLVLAWQLAVRTNRSS